MVALLSWPPFIILLHEFVIRVIRQTLCGNQLLHCADKHIVLYFHSLDRHEYLNDRQS